MSMRRRQGGIMRRLIGSNCRMGRVLREGRDYLKGVVEGKGCICVWGTVMDTTAGNSGLERYEEACCNYTC